MRPHGRAAWAWAALLATSLALAHLASPALAESATPAPLRATPANNDLLPPRANITWTPREQECQSAIMITGHRGGLGVGTPTDDGVRYTENTIPTFWRALVHYGVCAVETDLRRTCEGALVLNHDSRWNRTTNATGRVKARCLPYVQRKHADSGAPIATLAAFLTDLRETPSCYRQIELKAALTTADLQTMLSLTHEAVKDPSCVLFVSGSLTRLGRLDSLDPQVATGWLISDASLPDLSRVPSFVDLVMVDSRNLSAGFVAQAHQRGLMVSARRVNTAETLAQMAALGVDRVQTDHAAQVTAVQARQMGWRR